MIRLAILGLLLALAACRGQPSEQPPIHLVPDMRNQPKYLPLEENAFFADRRAARPPVEGTVARWQLPADPAFAQGRTAQGFLEKAPVELTAAVAHRGEERFNVYCAPCHDRSGSGRGMTVQRGFPPPVDLSSERVRGMPDGEIYEVINRGVRNMPAYGAQVPPEDRWAIVGWLRILQRSQNATIDDVPPDRREAIEPEAK